MPGRPISPLLLDLDRALPGESIEANDPEDAEHWIAVYSELMKTTQQMIENIREVAERQPTAVGAAIERTDMRLLQLQVRRFERRIAVWQAKLPAARS